MLGLTAATKMGSATVDFSALPPDVPTEYWLDLLDEDDEKKHGQSKKDLGRIHVKVRVANLNLVGQKATRLVTLSLISFGFAAFDFLAFFRPPFTAPFSILLLLVSLPPHASFRSKFCSRFFFCHPASFPSPNSSSLHPGRTHRERVPLLHGTVLRDARLPTR